MGASEFTTLERQVMQLLLEGDDRMLSVLREQFSQATLHSREMTGVGFLTSFRLPPGVPRVQPESFEFGDVDADIEGLKYGAGFVLFIRNGVIDWLEGYCYGENWPEATEHFVLKYGPEGAREWSELRSKWRTDR